VWLGAANGARSESEPDGRLEQRIKRQEDMSYVGMVRRTDDRMPGVCTGRASGSEEYRWDQPMSHLIP
jgi:hypothetical protein